MHPGTQTLALLGTVGDTTTAAHSSQFSCSSIPAKLFQDSALRRCNLGNNTLFDLPETIGSAQFLVRLQVRWLCARGCMSLTRIIPDLGIAPSVDQQPTV